MKAGSSEHGYNRRACYVFGRRASEYRASERCEHVTVRLLRGCAYRLECGAK